jgi:hypothetical protein
MGKILIGGHSWQIVGKTISISSVCNGTYLFSQAMQEAEIERILVPGQESKKKKKKSRDDMKS